MLVLAKPLWPVLSRQPRHRRHFQQDSVDPGAAFEDLSAAAAAL